MMLNSGNAAGARTALIQAKLSDYGPNDFASFLFRVKGVSKDEATKYMIGKDHFRARVRKSFFEHFRFAGRKLVACMRDLFAKVRDPLDPFDKMLVLEDFSEEFAKQNELENRRVLELVARLYMLNTEIHGRSKAGKLEKVCCEKFASQTNAGLYGFPKEELAGMYKDIERHEIRHVISDSELEHRRLVQHWRIGQAGEDS